MKSLWNDNLIAELNYGERHVYSIIYTFSATFPLCFKDIFAFNFSPVDLGQYALPNNLDGCRLQPSSAKAILAGTPVENVC